MDLGRDITVNVRHTAYSSSSCVCVRHANALCLNNLKGLVLRAAQSAHLWFLLTISYSVTSRLEIIKPETFTPMSQLRLLLARVSSTPSSRHSVSSLSGYSPTPGIRCISCLRFRVFVRQTPWYADVQHISLIVIIATTYLRRRRSRRDCIDT